MMYYIDRSAVARILTDPQYPYVPKIERAILDIPAEDVALVVRCRDCKWSNGGYCEYIGDLIPCGDWENWFCPSGEVKE